MEVIRKNQVPHLSSPTSQVPGVALGTERQLGSLPPRASGGVLHSAPHVALPTLIPLVRSEVCGNLFPAVPVGELRV